MTMRERPRDSAESAQEQYEKLLATSLAVHSKYRTMGDRILRLYAEGRGSEYGRLETQRRQLDRQLNDLMKQRVALVREIEHVKTIEDVFPRVKTLAKTEIDEMVATTILSAFSAGGIGNAEIQLAAEEIVGPMFGEDLSDEEYKALCAARASLARELGYEVENTADAENEEPSSWITLRKDGVRFELQHDAWPTNFGIMGNSRILKLHVTGGLGREEEFVDHLAYDGDWDEACTDQKVQREIDRVTAIFG